MKVHGQLSASFGSKDQFLAGDIGGSANVEKIAEDLARDVVQMLLLSRYELNNDEFRVLSGEGIQILCMRAIQLFEEAETVVEVKAPCKVFGDIHGQMGDLLELFQAYGSPNHLNGDVKLVNYVFVGDFVDRGSHSLEVVSLLFALKVLYPTKVFLIRGNHEDRAVNKLYGFHQECTERLGLAGDQSWGWFNHAFDYLPLGARIAGKILCIHGGLGESVHDIEQIRALKRPIIIEHESQTEKARLITDLLWSDPTSSDDIEGVHVNEQRGPNITTFGPDRVKSFCRQNDIDVVIRAHQCVHHGYEYFAGGHLITVFSATNYCGKYENHGAMLEITDELEITPKTIRAKGTIASPSQLDPHAEPQSLTWRPAQYRPPTPPRGRKASPRKPT